MSAGNAAYYEIGNNSENAESQKSGYQKNFCSASHNLLLFFVLMPKFENQTQVGTLDIVNE